MKERLIRLLKDSPQLDALDYNGFEQAAEWLISQGVIVPPCKVGDDIYWIDFDTNEINCVKNDIKAVCYFGNGDFKIICQDENTPEDIGTKWCFLTKEEAEKALERSEGR